MSLLFQYLAETVSFKGIFPIGRFFIDFLNNKQVHFTNPKILLSFNKTEASIKLQTIKIAQ